ncbi:hypothetical protein [Clostridium polynesiense]|uniref:hypothetical protein n=1 Tax=Clostridium polynesiense TaxID=1325933 RepID=UPI00058EE6C0|nr:hypothetical protein [Clostridium polynesiense]
MYKKSAALTAFILIAFLTACSCNVSKDSGKMPLKFDTKEAVKTAESYLSLIAAEDYKEADSLCSKELKGKSSDIKPSDLKVISFNQDMLNEMGESILIRFKVNRIIEGKPRADLDNCSIRVVKEGNQYKISEVKSENEKEAYVEGRALRQRRKDEAKSSPIIRLHRLPREMYPKNNKADINKAAIPNKEFSAVNFSYKGERIALSTFDKDSYLAVISIDDSMETVKDGMSGGESPQGSQGGQQNEGGDGFREDLSMEKPIGEKITSIDLLQNSRVNSMVFSRDEKILMVEYIEEGKGSSLNLYKADSGDKIPLNLNSQFPGDKYNVKFISFEKDLMIFQADIRDSEALKDNKAGKYQIDLETFNIKRL